MQTGIQKSGSGGWAAFGKLQSGNPNSQIPLQAVFPDSADYTVEFGMEMPDVSAYPGIVAAEATIIWSVEGNFVSRRVTVGNGVSVTGVGQGCRVVISDKSTGGPGLEYVVSAQVSKGSRGTTQQPPTLIPGPPIVLPGTSTVIGPGNVLVAPGDAVEFAVPEDAGVVSVFITAYPEPTSIPPPIIPPGAAVVTHNAGGVGGQTKYYDPIVYNKWVPVAAGTSIIVVSNQQAGGAPGIIFSVTFGIDG